MRTRIVGALVLLTGLVPMIDGVARASTHIWSQHFGGPLGEDAHAVAVDAAGNVLITGRFLDTASFGGSAFPSSGNYDMFLAKYDTGGTHLSELSVSSYPNPFNPRTTVSYTVPTRGNVRISIYDTRGALVTTLFNGDRSAGAYVIGWDGRGQSGTPVTTGVYFARIEHASGTRSKKMVLLK